MSVPGTGCGSGRQVSPGRGPVPGTSRGNASAMPPVSGRELALRHGLPLGEVFHVPELRVAADVAVLRADDQEHQVAVADVRRLAIRARRRVAEAARPELANLVAALEPRRPAVD